MLPVFCATAEIHSTSQGRMKFQDDSLQFRMPSFLSHLNYPHTCVIMSPMSIPLQAFRPFYSILDIGEYYWCIYCLYFDIVTKNKHIILSILSNRTTLLSVSLSSLRWFSSFGRLGLSPAFARFLALFRRLLVQLLP